MTEDSPAVTWRSRIAAWAPVLIAGGVVVVAGLVAIPLGGWDTVRLESAVIPEQAVGATYVGSRVAVSIDDLSLTDVHPDGYTEVEPGETFLVLVATMEGLTVTPEFPLETSSFYPFVIPGVLELGENLDFDRYAVVLERDGSFGPVLSPGVPDTLLFVFTVRGSEFAGGDEVRIGVTDATPEEADIYDGTRWVDVHIAVEVPITVRDDR